MTLALPYKFTQLLYGYLVFGL